MKANPRKSIYKANCEVNRGGKRLGNLLMLPWKISKEREQEEWWHCEVKNVEKIWVAGVECNRMAVTSCMPCTLLCWTGCRPASQWITRLAHKETAIHNELQWAYSIPYQPCSVLCFWLQSLQLHFLIGREQWWPQNEATIRLTCYRCINGEFDCIDCSTSAQVVAA